MRQRAVSRIRRFRESGRASLRDGLGARHPPASSRPRLLVRRSGRSRHPGARAHSSISLAGDSAGVERRVDLSDPGRTSPGHGARRAWTKAVPLPSELSCAPRSVEVRADGRAERRAVEGARARRARHRAAGLAAKEGDGDDRLAARAHADSRRQPRAGEGEQLVRPDDASPPSRVDRRRDAAVRVPRQERRRAHRRRDGSPHRAHRAALSRAAGTRALPVRRRTRASPDRVRGRRQHATCARSPVATSRRRTFARGWARCSPPNRCARWDPRRRSARRSATC